MQEAVDESRAKPAADGSAAQSRRGWMRLVATRGSFKRLAVLFAVLVLIVIGCYIAMVRMPGSSYRGALPPMSDSQLAASGRLKDDVAWIAGRIGQRSTYNNKSLAQTALQLKQELGDIGLEVLDHSFPARGAASPNLQVQITGSDPARASQIVLVGAHYDAFLGTPGADDNASGVAGILELARRFAGKPQPRTVRLVLFVNEEPPCFQTADMGSLIYANKARAAGDQIIAMLSLESIGYYRDDPRSQDYPFPLSWCYPSAGNFIAFVGNLDNRGLVHRAISAFRGGCQFPSEGAALPSRTPGIGWSDHWAFWKAGYPAIMVTATAPFRNPNYHQAGDTPETLDYDRLARVIDGLEVVIRELASGA